VRVSPAEAAMHSLSLRLHNAALLSAVEVLVRAALSAARPQKRSRVSRVAAPYNEPQKATKLDAPKLAALKR
jgi:hypothetical protein